jgi:hypothetical protein
MESSLQKVAELIDQYGAIYVRNNKNNPWRTILNVRLETQDEAFMVMQRFPARMIFQEKNGKMYYWLNYEYKKAIRIIEKILPFLVHQRPQALCVIDLENFKSLSRQQKQTEQVKIVRAQLLEKLNAENKARLKQKMGDTWQEK